MLKKSTAILVVIGLVVCNLVYFNQQHQKMFVGTKESSYQREKPIHENYLQNLSTACRYQKTLSKILLVINFSKPVYSIIPILKSLYGNVFKGIVFCGGKKSEHFDVLQVSERGGYTGYACLVEAVKKYPSGYIGYFFSNDDVLLNFWNLNFDPSKIWLGAKVSKKNYHHIGQTHAKLEWHWWSDEEQAADRCQKAYKKIEYLSNTTDCTNEKLGNYSNNQVHCTNIWKNSLKILHKNTVFQKTKIICLVGRSDVFYIPSRYKSSFESIGKIYVEEKVFLEVAVPTILSYLSSKTQHVNMKGMYYNDIYGYSKEYYNGKAFLDTYSTKLTFSHPFKLTGNNLNKIFLEKFFIPEFERRETLYNTMCLKKENLQVAKENTQ